MKILKKAASLAQAVIANQRVPKTVSDAREEICRTCSYNKTDGKHIYCNVCGCRVSKTSNRLLNLTTHVEHLPAWGCKHPRRPRNGWPMVVSTNSALAIEYFELSGRAVEYKHYNMRGIVAFDALEGIHKSAKVIGASYTGGIITEKAKYLGVKGPVTSKFLEQFGIDAPEVGDIALLMPSVYAPGKGETEIQKHIDLICSKDLVKTDDYQTFVLALAYGIPVSTTQDDTRFRDILEFLGADGSPYKVANRPQEIRKVLKRV